MKFPRTCKQTVVYLFLVVLVLAYWSSYLDNLTGDQNLHPDSSRGFYQNDSEPGKEETGWSDLFKCQAYRQERLKKRCDALGLTRNLTELTESELQQIGVQFMVDEYHNLILKSIPKTGCSSWKQIIMENHPQSEKHRDVWEHDWDALRTRMGYTTLDRLRRDEIIYRLQNYYTILTVRHPLMRLESFFKNKQIDEGRLGDNVLIDKSSFFQEKIGEYFQKELDSILLQPVANLNRHFAPYTSNMARECIIPYRFISKTETATQEMEYVIKHHLSGKGSPRRANTSHNVTATGTQPRSDGGIVLPIFSKLPDPQKTLDDLQRLFGDDMTIFGYSYTIENNQVIAICDSFKEFGYCC